MDDASERDLQVLAAELVSACMRARELDQPRCAEQIVVALEELARCSPSCADALDEAYLAHVPGSANQ